MYKKILVANDGSEHAKLAVSKAIGLAKCFSADLHMICVEEHLPHYAATVGEVLEEKAEEDRYFARIVREAKAQAAAEGVQLHALVTPGHEVETIVKYLGDNGFDLLVIGFMGHSRVFGRIMGSTASTLTRLAPCSVLVVK
ncbi:MAG: universal stress protein [Thermoleophilia bacterium]|nr:universal stress protein [Thermoleophilia bacterium]